MNCAHQQAGSARDRKPAFRFRIAGSVWLFLFLVSSAGSVLAQDDPAANGTPPAPASNLVAEDLDNDAGTAVLVKWDLSPDDVAGLIPRKVFNYEIWRRDDTPDAKVEEGADAEGFTRIAEPTYQVSSHEDKNCQRGHEYTYKIIAVAPDGAKSAAVQTAAPVKPVMQWLDKRRIWFGILLAIVGGAVIIFIEFARSGRDLKIRKIAGLEAVDEAVGRATEMGRSVLFINGIQDINDIQTVAGITVLSRVAGICAQYDAPLEVPTARSLVMTTARETVEAAYLGAGRHDAYKEDDIYYLTDEQFGFVASVTGTMIRKEPAACFYMGAFYAESLLLAETGNSIGAIQIAGTAMPSQLPFFVAACDYTLIGEEFFAASAYLSGEPHQLGSLKGQDLGKVVCALFILIGCVLATFESVAPGNETVSNTLGIVKQYVLGDKGFLPEKEENTP